MAFHPFGKVPAFHEFFVKSSKMSPKDGSMRYFHFNKMALTHCFRRLGFELTPKARTLIRVDSLVRQANAHLQDKNAIPIPLFRKLISNHLHAFKQDLPLFQANDYLRTQGKQIGSFEVHISRLEDRARHLRGSKGKIQINSDELETIRHLNNHSLAFELNKRNYERLQKLYKSEFKKLQGRTTFFKFLNTQNFANN